MAILKDSLDYLKTRNLTIDPMTEFIVGEAFGAIVEKPCCKRLLYICPVPHGKSGSRVHDSHRMAVALPVQLFFQLMVRPIAEIWTHQKKWISGSVI